MAAQFEKALQTAEGETHVVEDLKRRCVEIGDALSTKGSAGPDLARRLLHHLRDPLNVELRMKVRTGCIEADVLVDIPEEELINPEEKRKMKEEYEERQKSKNWSELKKAVSNVTNMFRCPKCGKNECSMIHKQTRSGDEPMTAFLTCMACGKVFKRQA